MTGSIHPKRGADHAMINVTLFILTLIFRPVGMPLPEEVEPKDDDIEPTILITDTGWILDDELEFVVNEDGALTIEYGSDEEWQIYF
jgi:hypothetical protein